MKVERDGFVGARLNLDDVEKGLLGLERTKNALRPMLNELRAPLREDQREHFKAEESPEGKWAPRAASTIAKATARRRGRTASGRRRRARKAKALLGRLPKSIDVKATSDNLIASSRAPWAGVHQEGGRGGRGARIPRRSFLWFSEKFLKIVEEFAGSILQMGWGGR